MAVPDYYMVLGLDERASEDDIKAAYRRLARQYHPDLNPNTTRLGSRFQLITEAYDILSDPAKRAAYDTQLKGTGPTMPPPPPPSGSANTPPPRGPAAGAAPAGYRYQAGSSQSGSAAPAAAIPPSSTTALKQARKLGQWLRAVGTTATVLLVAVVLSITTLLVMNAVFRALHYPTDSTSVASGIEFAGVVVVFFGTPILYYAVRRRTGRSFSIGRRGARIALAVSTVAGVITVVAAIVGQAGQTAQRVPTATPGPRRAVVHTPAAQSTSTPATVVRTPPTPRHTATRQHLAATATAVSRQTVIPKHLAAKTPAKPTNTATPTAKHTGGKIRLSGGSMTKGFTFTIRGPFKLHLHTVPTNQDSASTLQTTLVSFATGASETLMRTQVGFAVVADAKTGADGTFDAHASSSAANHGDTATPITDLNCSAGCRLTVNNAQNLRWTYTITK